MSTKILVAAVTLAFGLPAMALGQVIWPSAPGSPQPTPEQLPFLVAVSALESLLFGMGIAFLAFGLPIVQRPVASSLRAWSVYAAIGWTLVSWWPHDNFHRAVGMDIQGLIYLEYGFHVTLIAGALVIAAFFLDVMTGRLGSPVAARS